MDKDVVHPFWWVFAIFYIVMSYLSAPRAEGATAWHSVQEGATEEVSSEGDTLSVVFWNVENLFDAQHDEGRRDQDFTPSGKYAWTETTYQQKVANLARVLGEVGRRHHARRPAVIGLAEVENKKVLRALLAHKGLQGYGFVHHEGPDSRGIDCALLYDSTQLVVTHSVLHPYSPPQGSRSRSRGYLIVNGRLRGHEVYFVVCHWPSRAAPEETRLRAAEQVRALVDSLLALRTKPKVIVMGDLNDDPTDAAPMALNTTRQRTEMDERALYDAFPTPIREGTASYRYRDGWHRLDHILLSRGWLGDNAAAWVEASVFVRPYLIETSGPYKGWPKRGVSQGRWQNGYSDHLPVEVYVVR